VTSETGPAPKVLNASTPVAEAAREILDTRLKAVRKRLTPVREGDRAIDEEVHGLRVSTRRASAALGVFRPVLRKKDRRRTARTLRELRRSAAEARSADVHEDLLLKMLGAASGPRMAACGYALGRIETERTIGRVCLNSTAKRHTEKRVRRGDERLLDRIRDTKALGATTFGELTQIVVTDCFDRMELAMGGDVTSVERLHELRLAIKRFRYTLEVLEPCLDPSALDEAMTRARSLQQKLGDLNDLAELEARLESLAQELEDSDRAPEFTSVISGLRALQAEIDRAAREKRETFAAWWGGKGGPGVLGSLRTALLAVHEPEGDRGTIEEIKPPAKAPAPQAAGSESGRAGGRK